MNWATFFAMGGHAFYVWGVYAVAVVVLLYNVIQPLWYHRALRRRLRDYYRLKGKNQ